mmetsp:Transcript_1898/g.6064  ORF Transcript_1898/g.6064 Transcript_1898/m.6064 type:complete len:228 (+) Transcript_1898:331-1014(+)
MAIELLLQDAAVNVVGVLAEGVLDLHSYHIEAPIDEDLHEAEDAAPPNRARPVGHHERRDEPMHDQEDVAGLDVRKREGNRRDLDRAMVRDDTRGELLERTREERGRDAEHAGTDVVDDVLLDPLQQQLDPAVALHYRLEALGIQSSRIEEFIPEGLHGVKLVATPVLDLRQSCCVQHAEEPHQQMLEVHLRLLRRTREPAEGDDRAAGVKPLGAHLVGLRAAVPET